MPLTARPQEPKGVTVALEKEIAYYLDHEAELLKEHDGKVIVLKNQQVIGVYGSVADAATETRRQHERGTYLIQRVTTDPAVHTAKYVSPRVSVS